MVNEYQTIPERYNAELRHFFAMQAAFNNWLIEIITQDAKKPQSAKNTAIWRTIEEKQPQEDTPVLVENADGRQFIARWNGRKWNADNIVAWLELEPYNHK